MTISSLIQELRRLKELHGDVECVTPSSDDFNCATIRTVQAIKMRKAGIEYIEDPDGSIVVYINC